MHPIVEQHSIYRQAVAQADKAAAEAQRFNEWIAKKEATYQARQSRATGNKPKLLWRLTRTSRTLPQLRCRSTGSWDAMH